MGLWGRFGRKWHILGEGFGYRFGYIFWYGFGCGFVARLLDYTGSSKCRAIERKVEWQNKFRIQLKILEERRKPSSVA